MIDEVFKIKPGQPVFGVPVLKSVIGDYGPQVVHVSADDPRVSLRLMFTLDTAMHVQYCQRLCIGYCRRFNRLDRSILLLEVVLRGFLPFEERAAESDVSRLAELLRGTDLHLLGEQFDDISPKECVNDSFEPFRFELRPKMVEDRVRWWRVFAGVSQRRDRGLVGGRADEGLVDVPSIDFSVVGKVESNFLVKSVDEEVEELVLGDFTVCLLLVLGHIFSKQTSQLTGFVMY